MARVFLSEVHFTFMDNMGINSVGTESVFQTGQTGRTECLASVSREGLTRECLAGRPYSRDTRETQLSPSGLTLRIPVRARHMIYFAGC